MPARVPMSERQRQALLALPDTEDEVVRHHILDAADLAAVAEAITPETRLSYALQLCCLRYPGRNLKRGEVLPAVMLDHIAEQIAVDAGVIAGFARRGPTRYEQLASIKRRHGFRDLTHPDRAEIARWLVVGCCHANAKTSPQRGRAGGSAPEFGRLNAEQVVGDDESHFVQAPSVPAGRHSPGSVAVFPFHPEFSGRGGADGGTRDRGQL